MKKTLLCLLILFINLTLFSQTKANVKMLNGDEIPCSIMTETLDLVTDYGELSFETKYIKTIQFPEPGKGNTILNTIFSESFRGFITNDIIRLNVYGSEMEIRKAKINNITFMNETQQAVDFKITVSLRNGDAFYATPADSIINIQTSYGEVKLPFENMSEISFEGFGNVLTKIKMKDGGVLQGIIKDDYIPINLLSEIELEVVPDLMKEIDFVDEKEVAVVSDESLNTVTQLPLTINSERIFTQTGMEMVLVKNGTFNMGNTFGIKGDADEKPVHDVTISYDFYIGRNEVTFKDFDEYCKDMYLSEKSDKGWGRDQQPIFSVSFAEAIKFCNWLSEKENLKPAYDKSGNLINKSGKTTDNISDIEGYRLPTEAEWEYAARGGHKATQDYYYAGSYDLNEVGWYKENSNNKTHKVGSKKANELGIYDMSGNLWEWCFDYYSDNYYKKYQKYNPLNTEKNDLRVTRGGSYIRTMENAQVSARSFYNERYSSNRIGFRIAKTK